MVNSKTVFLLTLVLRVVVLQPQPFVFQDSVETSFVSSTALQFNGFWLRIIQEGDLVDLFQIQAPLVLDYKPTIFPAQWRYHICHVYGNLTAPKEYQEHGIAKIQNARGLLTFLVLPPISQAVSKAEARIDFYRKIVLTSAKNPLWGTSVHCKGPWLYPQYVVFVNCDRIRHSFREYNLLSGTYMRLEGIFFISFLEMHSENHVAGHVHIFCKTCVQRWYQHACFDMSTCPAEMRAVLRVALNGGRATQWRFQQGHNQYLPQALRNGTSCTFWSVTCKVEADAALRLFQLLAEPFNLTYTSTRRLSRADVSVYGELNSADKLNMFELVGYRSELRFVTADGVSADVRSGLLSSLWRPLLSAVWILTFLSIATFTVLYASLLPSSDPCMAANCAQALQLSCLLTGQSSDVNEEQVHAFKRPAYHTLASTWLIFAVLINAFYSAMFSSNFISTPVYKTVFTRLEQLENFSLYFSDEGRRGSIDVSIRNASGVGVVTQRQGLFGLRYDAINRWYSFKCPRSGNLMTPNACDTLADEIQAFLGYHTGHGDPKYDEWRAQHRAMLLNVIKNAEFYPETRIQQTILEQLLKPKTAAVIPTESIRKYWATFKAVTRETGRQFGNNFERDDDIFRRPKMYMVSDRLGEEHGSFMQKRLRGIMQSGIYWIWEKWTKCRDKTTARRGRSESREMKSLALGNSEIFDPFYALGIGLGLSLACFFVEVFMKAVAPVWKVG